jgi:adenylosuccinate synthase
MFLQSFIFSYFTTEELRSFAIVSRKYIFHLLPNGVLNKGSTCVTGNGVVVHIPTFLNEFDALVESGIDNAVK